MNHKDALKDPVFKTLNEVSESMGLSSFVIGGFTRDYLLGKENPKD